MAASRADRTADPRAELRRRILATFGRRARERGFKAVVMAELAAELGISTKTLYAEFATKADLVQALVEDLAARFEADQAARIATVADPVERVKDAVRSWLGNVGRIRASFWNELRTNHPAAHAALAKTVKRIDERGRSWLAAEVRDDLPQPLAFAFLVALLARALDPEFCDRIGMTRAQATEQAIDFWARSALRPRAGPRAARRRPKPPSLIPRPSEGTPR